MQAMRSKISPQRIADLCHAPARRVAIQVVAETGSTNADLLAGLDTLSSPVLLIAEKQTAGRGRAGRTWHSEPGQSLTFSLAWKFDLPMHALVGLPLAAGVVIAETLRMFDVTADLKWPNDVLYQGRKLAGILIETASAGILRRQESWAVIGIGLNMGVPDHIAAQIGRPVAGISWLADVDQDMLMATLLNGLSEAMMQFEEHRMAAFVQRWNALHAYTGQPVVILDNGRVLHEGVAVGIDPIGRFLLDTAAGQVAVMAGDVSLRLRENAREKIAGRIG
jgi:BirA family biotin operon repressor/biotin-[acetyl-CoA-carboxylase] ligase